MSATDDAVARRVENSIGEIRGIRRTRVDVKDGIVRGVRVLVIPERPNAEVVDEVRNIVQRDTGGRISSDAIEILRSNVSTSGPLQRRKLSSVATERTQNRFKARVVLELSGDTLVGESDSPSEKTFEFRSVARATLDSLRKLMTGRIDLELVDVLNSGSHQLAVVALRYDHGTLIGTALVKLDHHDAIARATLDALNRYLSAPSVSADGAHALS